MLLPPDTYFSSELHPSISLAGVEALIDVVHYDLVVVLIVLTELNRINPFEGRGTGFNRSTCEGGSRHAVSMDYYLIWTDSIEAPGAGLLAPQRSSSAAM